ncbi:MAG: cell division topological specificity factor MinE [Deltaproteobacteria bacterium]|nr:MAG: cell division topological specificity factor MinE [Deltaproteobacteria bacterium]
MGILEFFFNKKETSAGKAKNRLQIIIAEERSTRSGPDYLPRLKEELLLVVRKYIQVPDGAVKVKVDREEDYEVLELNVTLPSDKADESLR